jgi:NAD(P)-dependent dehydrogenase (short-subunit alcohol dehydrogenase family)
VTVRLEGRVAVVTGASSGIGRAIAIRFAAEGATVVASDVREDPIWAPAGESRSTIDTIAEQGGRAEYVSADVSSERDVAALIDGAVDRHGSIDALVNSAGIFDSFSILDTTLENWERIMSVNLRGPFLCSKRAIAHMVDQEPRGEVRGRIVNITSQHGMIGPPEYCAYGVSKAGVVQLTRQVAVDYARKGIMVNAVAPGRIMTGTHPGEPEYLEQGEIDADTEYSLSRTPFPRLGRSEDVAGAALYLASDDCSFVSGHNLLVDGGWMAY